MISTLGELAFWVGVALCLVAQVAITLASLRPKRAHVPDDVHLPRPSRVWETAWTLVPAVALALVLVSTWRAMHPPDDSLTAVPASSAHDHP